MKELIEAFHARIKSPVFGYFVFAWLLINWKAIFYLFFDSGTVKERIQIFENLTDYYTSFLYPLSTGVAAAVIAPWINYLFLRICSKPTDLRNTIQAESEHRLLLKKQELEETRSKVLATKERDLIERAKRDEEIQSISDEATKEELQKQIDKLRHEIDSQRELNSSLPKNSRNRSDVIGLYREMADLLREQGRLEDAESYLQMAIANEGG